MPYDNDYISNFGNNYLAGGGTWDNLTNIASSKGVTSDQLTGAGLRQGMRSWMYGVNATDPNANGGYNTFRDPTSGQVYNRSWTTSAGGGGEGGQNTTTQNGYTSTDGKDWYQGQQGYAYDMNGNKTSQWDVSDPNKGTFTIGGKIALGAIAAMAGGAAYGGLTGGGGAASGAGTGASGLGSTPGIGTTFGVVDGSVGAGAGTGLTTGTGTGMGLGTGLTATPGAGLTLANTTGTGLGLSSAAGSNGLLTGAGLTTGLTAATGTGLGLNGITAGNALVSGAGLGNGLAYGSGTLLGDAALQGTSTLADGTILPPTATPPVTPPVTTPPGGSVRPPIPPIPGGTGSGSSSGGSGLGGLGLGDLLKLLGGGLDYSNQNKASNDMLNYLKGQQDKVDKLYAPGSNEYNYLSQQLDRKDASAGRMSQYGPRSVDLAARIAQIKADETVKMTTGIGNIYQHALNQRAAAPSGLMSSLSSLSKGLGYSVSDISKWLNSNGLSNLFNSNGDWNPDTSTTSNADNFNPEDGDLGQYL